MENSQQFQQLLQNLLITLDNKIIEIGESQYKQQQNHKINIGNNKLIQSEIIEQFCNINQSYQNQWKLFDLIQPNYNESLDNQINTVKMNSVSLRRKDELFKRHKKQQEQKIVLRRKQLQQKYSFNQNQLKFQGQFTLRRNQKNQIFAFKIQDFQKLKPQTDLNDTIIDNYLKIMQTVLLSQQTSKKTFIFSTFFMGKLLGQLKQQTYSDKQNQNNLQKILKKVHDVYPTIKRWTKKSDLFSKQYLIVPINAYKHWNCMIIVSPTALLTQPQQCKIIYLDSVFQKKLIFPQAIKTFLQLELQSRKNKKISFQNVVTYQLLVPRQTNNHDCGLYTLCYIEYLLKNHQILQLNMEIIDNRYQLRLFPRSLIFAMRELLRLLFKNLLINEDKNEAIQDYIKLREQIQKDSKQTDYDEINEKQFKKYYKMNSHLLEDKKKKQSQIQYQCKVKFYLDCQINHYQKDQGI